MKPDRSEPSGPVTVPGVHGVEAILHHAPHRLLEVRYAGQLTAARGRVVEAARAAGVTVTEVRAAHIDALAEGIRHQGVLGLAEPATYVDFEDLLGASDNPLIVAFDQVTDPHNLGAILRAAEVLGATGAVLTKNRCARLGPAVTRTSAGASEVLPVALETNLARTLRSAQKAGLQVVGADLEGVPPAEVDFAAPTVLVVGAEGRGLRRLTHDTCDVLCAIPMSGRIASLNAATAAAILLYEVARQRGPETGNF